MRPYYSPENNLYPNYSVVGTYYHADGIRRLIGGAPPQGQHYESTDHLASLVPEPDNPHDRNAVSVRINGWLVGYLAREDAQTYARVLHRLAASGYELVLPTRIYAYQSLAWSGERRQRQELELESTINIALPQPHKIVPLNDDFRSELTLLPWGRAVQVRGEEEHLDHLFDYVPADGSGLVIATLRRAVRVLKNGTEREYVEVRVNGQKAGQISPQSSAHFLPAIRHVEEQGRILAGWAKFEGSALAVNVTVQAARSTDLTDEWLSELPGVPVLVPKAPTYDVPPAFGTDKESRAPKSRPRQAPRERPQPSSTDGRVPPQASPAQRVVGSGPAGQPGGSEQKDDVEKNKKAGAGCCGCLLVLVVLVVLIALL